MLLHVPHVRPDVTVVIVRPVILGSLGQEMTATALCVMAALQDGIKTQWGKEVVCRVFQGLLPTTREKRIVISVFVVLFKMI